MTALCSKRPRSTHTPLTPHYAAEELRLLQQHASAIAEYVPGDAVLVELGCGCARKTGQLVAAIAKR